MKRVLVTGASGFVGRHLRPALEARGLGVIGADRTTDAEGLQLDVRDAERTREVVGRVAPDAVIHLAALSSAGRSFRDPRAVLEVNGLGTFHVLEAVRLEAPDARVLVVSSADIYGPSRPGAAHTEDAPLCPVSPYGASKAWQDLLTAQYSAAYSLDAIRIRPFSHTGPGQSPTFVLASFAEQIATIEEGGGEPVLRVGALDVVRDYLDVRDVVECYCEILLRADRGEVLNVCSGHGRRLGDLLELLLDRARVSIRVEHDAERLRPADIAHLVGDPGRVRRQLGFEPQLTMERTLADLLEDARRGVRQRRV